MKKVYICRDSVTGLYSAIYDAWKERRDSGMAGIAVKDRIVPELFCEYVETEETEKKALAVEKLIREHLGEYAYSRLYYAALSHEPDKGDAIFGTMRAARKLADSTRIMDHLTEPSARRTFELSRNVGNEAHYFKEFLRFRELRNGVLFAKIEPKNQVLTCIAPHFADRLPLENWMIYDKTHGMFVVHEARKRWVLVSDACADESRFDEYSEAEEEIQELWKGFFNTISIEERESYARQRQHLPIWYRKNMVEFDE